MGWLNYVFVCSPLEQFEIIPIVAFRLGTLDFSFTNASLAMLFSAGGFLFLMRLIQANHYLIANRWQYTIEALFSFVLTIVVDNIGIKGQRYFPFVFVLFIFILFSNLLGMIPYSFTATSHLIVTFSLGLGVFLGVNIVIIREHKMKAFGLFLPPGSPIVLAPMLVLIEMISYFIRVVSLSVRLFANIMSGHILLKVLLGFAWTMATSISLIMVLLHLLPLSIVFLLVGLEIGVAIIQAYVFTILTCLYLNEAIHLH